MQLFNEIWYRTVHKCPLTVPTIDTRARTTVWKSLPWYNFLWFKVPIEPIRDDPLYHYYEISVEFDSPMEANETLLVHFWLGSEEENFLNEDTI